MSDLSNLTTTRSNILAKLASITASSQKSYNIDGQSVDHNAYRESLLRSLKQIDEVMVSTGGPFEVETVGEA